jgi:hypothetical protein
MFTLNAAELSQISSSDAFGPQEDVTLFALVTYNNAPWLEKMLFSKSAAKTFHRFTIALQEPMTME